jgi:DNA polymerase-3 subunit alpha (Gram-positive type)
MMSYRIAWFKRYYPAAFYSAILSKKSSVTFDYYMMDSKTLVDTIFKLLRTKNAKDKKDASILEIIFDAKQHNIEFELPNIYESEAEKFIVKNNKILLPLNTIKGLGTSVANNIVNERNKLQFMSVEDFKKRVKANKNHIAILQEIGAMEGLTSDAPTVFV